MIIAAALAAAAAAATEGNKKQPTQYIDNEVNGNCSNKIKV